MGFRVRQHFRSIVFNLNSLIMKKINIIAAAISTVLAIASCDKGGLNFTLVEKPSQDNPSITEPSGEMKDISFIINPLTKSQWIDGEGFTWFSEGDTQFGIFTNDGSNVQSTSVAIDGKDIVVTATVPVEATKMIVYYPYSNAYGQGVSTTAPLTWWGFLEMADQKQSEAGSVIFDTEGGNGNLALASATPVDLTAVSSPFSVKMVPMSSVVRFIIYASEGSDASVKSVTLTASSATNNLNGQEQNTFNFETGAVSTIFSAAGTLSNKVTLTTPYSLSGVTSKANASGIYMGIQPVRMTGFTVVVKLDDNSEYEFSAPSNVLDIPSGTIKDIYIDLKNATRTPYSPEIAVSRSTINVAADATSTTFSVTGKYIGWTATPSSGVTLDVSSGSFTTENSTMITASFAANTSDAPVAHTVTISNDEGLPNLVVTINQAEAGAAPVNFSYTFAGWQEGGNRSFRRTATSAGSSENKTYVLVFANIRKDSGSGEEVPTNEDGWDLLKYGFQLTSAELTELQAMADFSFNLNDGESVVYFNGIRSTTGSKRVFNKFFKTSDLSSDYVQVTLTQSGTSITPLDYNSASNLWKPVDDAAAAGFGYQYAGHYGAGKGSSYEIVSYASGVYTVDAKYGTGGTWDNQLFIFPGAGHEVSLSPTSVYELQLTIESDKDITGNTLFFKIASYDEANPKGEGAGLKDYGIYNLTAGTPLTIDLFGLSNFTAENICLVFGLGGNPDNTTITISNITLVAL